MPEPSALKRLFDRFTGSEKRRLKAKAIKWQRDMIAQKERRRREAGIPDGVELNSNGGIADADVWLRWTIDRMAALGGTSLRLDRHKVTSLPAEIAQLSHTLRKLTIRGQSQSVFEETRVLVNLQEIELDVRALEDLSPLESFPHLKTLKIYGATKDNMASLPDLPELEKLTVTLGSVAGLSASLPRLNYLRLSSCQDIPSNILQGKSSLEIADLGATCVQLRPSSNPTSLRKLVCKTNARDLSNIGAMRNLTSLELNAGEATDLLPLSALKNLTYLHLHVPKADSFAPLEGLRSLETLIMPGHSDEAVMPDLSWLCGCPALTDLRISITPDADLADLAHLPELNYLGLRFWEPIDVSALGNNVSIKGLKLSARTPKASVRNFALPKGLTELCLFGGSFTSLESLSSKISLTKLSLEDCGITDLSPLATQTELTSLGLFRTPAADLSVLRHLPAFNVENTTANLYINDRRASAILDAYPSLRPYVERANAREAETQAMADLVRAAVAVVA